MLYTLRIAVLLSSTVLVNHKPQTIMRETVFSIPYPSLYECQKGQMVIDNYKDDVGVMAARQWLPSKLAPIAAQVACVMNPTFFS